jgi:glucose/arabinose dehydrogenase
VARAAPPASPVITEPATDGQLVHPADVHMEAAGYGDPDGDAHWCSDWRILDGSTTAWRASCATGLSAVHIHLGDGSFVNGYDRLAFDHPYTLQVRFVDARAEESEWASRAFGTYPASSPGGSVAWTPLDPGYRVETVADDLQLPVNVAFVPDPGTGRKDPLLYVTELYGTVKVITRDGTEGDYATGLLNFDPTGVFPGSGEQGLTGIVVDPATGDVIVSLLYDGDGSEATLDDHHPELLRLHSEDGGRTAATRTPLLRAEMAGEIQGASHQISNLTFGPDGKLYVHVGDGFDPSSALDLDSYRGKVLRVNPDGSPPVDNPLYDGGVRDARDYIWAYGFRNPFGGAWREANGAQYEVEDGPDVDRLARLAGGSSYGWDGSNASMATGALYNWHPAHAPVNIAFVQRGTFAGSGFPAGMMDRAFVTESGPTWATGPQALGKRIVEFEPQPNGELGGHPHGFVEYTGTGKATAAGLTAGPDGLYFTTLYEDRGYAGATDPGAELLRVRYVGVPDFCRIDGDVLRIGIRRGARVSLRRDGQWIEVDGERCGARVNSIDRIAVKGRRGNETLVVDLRGGPLGPGISAESPGLAEIELLAKLGAGRHDRVVVIGGAGDDFLRVLGNDVLLDLDRDPDLIGHGAERFDLRGGAGRDRLIGNRGPNLLVGGGGADLLVGRAGRDRLRGKNGRDVFRGGAGWDRCDDLRWERSSSCERESPRR